MSELTQSAVRDAAPGRAWGTWLRSLVKVPGAVLHEFSVLFAVSAFLMLFGLIPIFGGDQLGLVGADEPRYAQVAREMLQAHEATCAALHADTIPRSLHSADLKASFQCILAGTVTPILNGQPWLEK